MTRLSFRQVLRDDLDRQELQHAVRYGCCLCCGALVDVDQGEYSCPGCGRCWGSPSEDLVAEILAHPVPVRLSRPIPFAPGPQGDGLAEGVPTATGRNRRTKTTRPRG
jgi:hypothetical protein